MSSIISAPHTIAKALANLGKITLGSSPYSPLHAELSKNLNVPFIDGLASIGSSDPVNEFLKRKGFTIQLPKIGPVDIATAGTVDIMVNWMSEGTLRTLKIQDKSVPATRLSSFRQLSIVDHPHPVFHLSTKELGLQVYVTKATDSTGDFVSLQQKLSLLKLVPNIPHFDTSYDAIILPMINMDISGSIPQVDGLIVDTDTSTYIVGSAMFQGILKLNEHGARAKAAAAMLCYATSFRESKPDYFMDAPFWFWIKQGETTYFAAYVDLDCMSEPKDLN
jgi:hypothetical protein